MDIWDNERLYEERNEKLFLYIRWFYFYITLTIYPIDPIIDSAIKWRKRIKERESKVYAINYGVCIDCIPMRYTVHYLPSYSFKKLMNLFP